MNLQDMYPAVLTLVLVAILLGVGLTVLGGLKTGGAMTAAANTSLDTSITAIGGFGSWFSIIVVVLVAAIIIGLVIHSFSGK